jgi:hypothetical protein
MIDKIKRASRFRQGAVRRAEEEQRGIQRGKTILSSPPYDRSLYHLLSQAAYLLAKPAVRRIVVESLVPHHVVIESPNLGGGAAIHRTDPD